MKPDYSSRPWQLRAELRAERRCFSRLILIIVLSIIETNSSWTERIRASLSWEGSESSISEFVSIFETIENHRNRCLTFSILSWVEREIQWLYRSTLNNDTRFIPTKCQPAWRLWFISKWNNNWLTVYDKQSMNYFNCSRVFMSFLCCLVDIRISYILLLTSPAIWNVLGW